MKNILFIAPPAGGKGTLSDELVKNYGYIHISTGDLLRDVDKSSKLGIMVNELISKGSLVPDDIVLALLKEKLESIDKTTPFIVDGYPRNIDQAHALEKVLDELGLTLHSAILLDVPYDIVLKRAIGRVSCPNCKATFNTFFKLPKESGKCDECGSELFHRSDDNEETFLTRYNTYMKNAEPLIEFYKSKDKLVKIDGINNTLSLLVSVIQ